MPILLLMALPFLEVYVLYEVALVYGFMNLLFFLIIKGMIGKMIMRYASQRGLNGLNDLRVGAQAAVLGLAGLLITLPALITNTVGLLMLFPPTKWLLMKIFKKAFNNFSNNGNFRTFNFGRFNSGMPGQKPFTSGNFDPSFHQNLGGERDFTPRIIDVSPIQKTEKKD